MRIVAKHTCIRICQTSLALVICGRIYGHYLLHITQNDTAVIIYNLIMSTYMVRVSMRVKIEHKRKRIYVTALGELLFVNLNRLQKEYGR